MACISVKFRFHDSISLLCASRILLSCRGRVVALRTDSIRAPPSSSARPRGFASTAVLVACTLPAPMVPSASPVLSRAVSTVSIQAQASELVSAIYVLGARTRSSCPGLFARHPIPCSCTFRLGVGRDVVAEDCTLTGELRRRACGSHCSHSAVVLILSL
ncbi:hypothetical protein DFH09DRAFT_1190876 [Mycena vulgaris]|nr:hypothetical protein DFH09DRAFT_1190876 [Mycena vulgaris]